MKAGEFMDRKQVDRLRATRDVLVDIVAEEVEIDKAISEETDEEMIQALEIIKGKGTKYVKRTWKNGRWRYYYDRAKAGVKRAGSETLAGTKKVAGSALATGGILAAGAGLAVASAGVAAAGGGIAVAASGYDDDKKADKKYAKDVKTAKKEEKKRSIKRTFGALRRKLSFKKK